ncbi:MAG: hypothetical protein GOV02_01625 [Candidatus Aenigmarchaeota archaeon]|nr:hypothetical protein [Candidatus Aenigmarchaeota archaeon]
MKYVDGHIHLPIFKNNADWIIKKSRRFGVRHLVSVSTNYDNSEKNVKMCSKYDNVSAFVGTHPFCFGSPYTDGAPGLNVKWLYREIHEMEKLAPKADGIGEVGIDHYLIPNLNTQKRKEQQYLFSKMCEIAEENDKPMIVHCLDSAGSVYNILEEYNVNPVVIHSFRGTKQLLDRGLKNGYYFSVMPKNNKLDFYPDVDMVVDRAPIDRILVESDAPRKDGKIFDSRTVPQIVKEIATRRNLSFKKTAWEIYDTSKKVFNV